jgi:hypothetical protein
VVLPFSFFSLKIGAGLLDRQIDTNYEYEFEENLRIDKFTGYGKITGLFA